MFNPTHIKYHPKKARAPYSGFSIRIFSKACNESFNVFKIYMTNNKRENNSKLFS